MVSLNRDGFMKKDKKGFTLIEILVCLVIMIAIAGIFSINFIKNLNSNKQREYDDLIKKIEASADAYVTLHKSREDYDYKDLHLVMENDDSFAYITLEELDDDGLLTKDNLTNPMNGRTLSGVVKFSNDKGIYEFEYIENPEGLITVVYERNGAESISRTAKAFICETSDIASCVQDTLLPSIERPDGRVFGWSTNPDDTSSQYKSHTSLKTLLTNKSYRLEGTKLHIYAITSAPRIIHFEDPDNPYNFVSNLSCTVYNNTPSCPIKLPDFTVEPYYEKVGWNTNPNKTGIDHKIGTKLDVDKSTTLYLNKKIRDFDIKVNKLNRISSTETIPANINIIFVLDVSGSMSGSSRLGNLKKVTTGLVDKMNFTNSTVSLIPFASGSSTRLSFSNDRLRIKSEINSLSAGGGTNFSSAIATTNSLASNIPNSNPTFVIFVSDGYSSISSSDTNLRELKSKTTIYSMGIGAGHDTDTLTTIASSYKTYYSYNDSSDDSSLTKFYELFQDIIQDITILQGDGEENAITMTVKNGLLDMGNLVLSPKYPITIYLNNSLIDTFTSENNYLKKNGSNYTFNVFEYAKNKSSIGVENMSRLRIKYFYTRDK